MSPAFLTNNPTQEKLRAEFGRFVLVRQHLVRISTALTGFGCLREVREFNLTLGGTFMYPCETNGARKRGKPRSGSGVNPMNFIVEKAGGMHSTG